MAGKRKRRKVDGWSILCAVLLMLALINTFFIGFVRVSGNSMSPTIPNDSLAIVERMGFDIARNDVVVAMSPDGIPVIKRAVGLPGDTLEITEDGDIYINGEKYDNKYQSAYYPGAAYVGTEITLGDDEYFLLGDNRYDSRDSRFYGPVSKKKIYGTVINVLMTNTQRIRAEEIVESETAPAD